MKRISLALLFMVGLSACASLTTTTTNNDADIPWVSPAQATAPDDTQPLSEAQQLALEQASQLQELESHLSGREARQYARLKPSLGTDAQRIAFLQLGSYEARQRWAVSHGLDGADPYLEGNFATELRLGMNKEDVERAWGDPELVEVAGDPNYGNERWKYSQNVATDDGFVKVTRIIYFEAGRVRGWQTVH